MKTAEQESTVGTTQGNFKLNWTPGDFTEATNYRLQKCEVCGKSVVESSLDLVRTGRFTHQLACVPCCKKNDWFDD